MFQTIHCERQSNATVLTTSGAAGRAPGLKISEVFPKLAAVMDRVTLIRSVTSPEADHDRAAHHLLTGYRPSPALVYLVIGMAIGPWGLGWLRPDPDTHTVLLERAAEIAVLVSLFATGSAVGTTLRASHWRVPVRLASAGMIVTVLLLAGFAYWILDLSIGASLVLGTSGTIAKLLALPVFCAVVIGSRSVFHFCSSCLER